MGTRFRLALLMLTAILANVPPSRPPGSGTGESDDHVDLAVCRCGAETIDREGSYYYCATCDEWFTPEETA